MAYFLQHTSHGKPHLVSLEAVCLLLTEELLAFLAVLCWEWQWGGDFGDGGVDSSVEEGTAKHDTQMCDLRLDFGSFIWAPCPPSSSRLIWSCVCLSLIHI